MPITIQHHLIMTGTDKLRAYLEKFAIIPEYLWHDWASKIEKRTYAKGNMLCHEGEVAKNLYYVLEGQIKCYSLKAGKTMCCQFGLTGDLIGAYTSLLHQQPSRIFIEVSKRTTVLIIPRNRWFDLINSSKAGERIGRLYAQFLYLQKEEQVLGFLTLSAKDNYKYLYENYRPYFDNIQQKDLATYLGIWPESLCRIREELRQEGYF